MVIYLHQNLKIDSRIDFKTFNRLNSDINSILRSLAFCYFFRFSLIINNFVINNFLVNQLSYSIELKIKKAFRIV